jgi:hypothetical protein
MANIEIVERVIALAKPQHDALKDWTHKWPHIQDVAEKSETLTKMEDISPVAPCLIASCCHDLGRVEEERRKERGDLFIHHSRLSLLPTIQVLQQVGISGVEFYEIVEAVAVHSYRVYEEKNNNAARILQDADKMSGLSTWGIVAITKYFSGKDYIDGQEILDNWRDKKKIRELSDHVLNMIEGGEILQGVMKGLRNNIEWYDMFHTKSAKDLMTEDCEYLVKCRDFLAQKYGLSEKDNVSKK